MCPPTGTNYWAPPPSTWNSHEEFIRQHIIVTDYDQSICLIQYGKQADKNHPTLSLFLVGNTIASRKSEANSFQGTSGMLLSGRRTSRFNICTRRGENRVLEHTLSGDDEKTLLSYLHLIKLTFIHVISVNEHLINIGSVQAAGWVLRETSLFQLSLGAAYGLAGETPSCVREPGKEMLLSGLELHLCSRLAVPIGLSDSTCVSTNFLIIYKVEVMVSAPLSP